MTLLQTKRAAPGPAAYTGPLPAEILETFGEVYYKSFPHGSKLLGVQEIHDAGRVGLTASGLRLTIKQLQGSKSAPQKIHQHVSKRFVASSSALRFLWFGGS